jgi:hypothetical protein
MWFLGLLHHVVWQLDTNVSEDCAASIFRVEVHGKQKLDTDIDRVQGGVGVRWV